MEGPLLRLYDTERGKAISFALKNIRASWLSTEERTEVAEDIFHDTIIILDKRYSHITELVRLRQLLYRIMPRRIAEWYWVQVDQHAYEKHAKLNEPDYLFVPPSTLHEREYNKLRRERKARWTKEYRAKNYELVRQREKESYQRNRAQKLAAAKRQYQKRKKEGYFKKRKLLTNPKA